MKISTRKVIINHPYFAQAKRHLQRAYDSYDSEEPLCVPIIGPSGTGKSTVIADFIETIGVQDDGMTKSVVVIETPSNPTVKSMASEVLSAIGDPMYYRGTEVQMTARIIEYLKALETRLLIFDELQNLIDRESDKLSFKAADWLKRLVNKSKIPVVIVGLERTRELFLVNEQLRRRFTESYTMHPFHWAVPEAKLALLGFLGAVQTQYNFDPQLKLTTADIAYRMYCATGGLVGYIMAIINEAKKLACGSAITMQHLAEAYASTVNGNTLVGINPFIRSDSEQLEAALAVVEESKPIRRRSKIR